MEEGLSDQAAGGPSAASPVYELPAGERVKGKNERKGSAASLPNSGSGHLGTLNGVLIPTCENM